MGKKALLSLVSAILSSLNFANAVPGNHRISQMSIKNHLKRKRQRNVVGRSFNLEQKEAQLIENHPQKELNENRNNSKNASKEQSIPKIGDQNSKGFKNLVVGHPITFTIGGVIAAGTVAAAIGIPVKHYCFGSSEDTDPTVDSEGNPIVGEVFLWLR